MIASNSACVVQADPARSPALHCFSCRLQGVIGSVGEVQFMGDVGVFGEFAKSFTLFACVARMVEHNRRASREQA